MANNLLTINEVADAFKTSRRTLEKFRREGIGPKFVKIGKRIMYREEDLDAWIESILVNPEEPNG